MSDETNNNQTTIGRVRGIDSKRERIRIEDALKSIHDSIYEGQPATVDSLAGAMGIPREEILKTLSRLESVQLVTSEKGSITLTEKGESYALHIVRAHRLFETFLAQESGVQETDWHALAHVSEHDLSLLQIDELANRLGNPRFDPHGDPIPRKSGELAPLKGTPLTDYPENTYLHVLHIEDEPLSLYAQITKMGFYPGMRLFIHERENGRMLVNAEGREFRISAIQASAIRVEALVDQENQPKFPERLTDLEPKERAIVLGLTPLSRGAERRRLLDLGFVPGSTVEFDMRGAFSSPISYLVRGTHIALRKEQAEQILIQKQENN